MSLSDVPLANTKRIRFGARLGRNFRPFLVVLGWGTSFAGITLWAIFQGLLLPKSTLLPPSVTQGQTANILLAVYYSIIFGVSFVSGLCVGDLAKTIVGSFASYLLAAAIVYEVLSFPGLVSPDIGFRESLAMFSVNWTFVALFPFPLALGLIGGIVGASLQETIIG